MFFQIHTDPLNKFHDVIHVLFSKQKGKPLEKHVNKLVSFQQLSRERERKSVPKVMRPTIKAITMVTHCDVFSSESKTLRSVSSFFDIFHKLMQPIFSLLLLNQELFSFLETCSVVYKPQTPPIVFFENHVHEKEPKRTQTN